MIPDIYKEAQIKSTQRIWKNYAVVKGVYHL